MYPWLCWASFFMLLPLLGTVFRSPSSSCSCSVTSGIVDWLTLEFFPIVGFLELCEIFVHSVLSLPTTTHCFTPGLSEFPSSQFRYKIISLSLNHSLCENRMCGFYYYYFCSPLVIICFARENLGIEQMQKNPLERFPVSIRLIANVCVTRTSTPDMGESM